MVDAFIQDLRIRSRSPSTIRLYNQDLLRFQQFLARNLKTATRQDITSYLAALNVSPRTKMRILGCLRSFYAFGVRSGFIPANPTTSISLPRLSVRLPQVLTETQMMQILNTSMTSRDKLILELLYDGMMRVSELHNLRIEDINIPAGEVRIRSGKGRKDRIILIGQYAQELLQTYQYPASDTLIRLSVRQIQRIVKKYTATHPHVLRHSAATHMMNRGANTRVIQHLLGHASLTTTQIYTHTSHSFLQKEYRHAHPRA